MPNSEVGNFIRRNANLNNFQNTLNSTAPKWIPKEDKNNIKAYLLKEVENYILVTDPQNNSFIIPLEASNLAIVKLGSFSRVLKTIYYNKDRRYFVAGNHYAVYLKGEVDLTFSFTTTPQPGMKLGDFLESKTRLMDLNPKLKQYLKIGESLTKATLVVDMKAVDNTIINLTLE